MTNHSSLFEPGTSQAIEDAILVMLNKEPYFLTAATATSPRAVGDAVQSILSQKLIQVLGPSIQNYSPTLARRAMADIAFTDVDGFSYAVDVKTHRLDTSFNMPNLTSVERLTTYYEQDSNYFAVLFVDYSFSTAELIFEKVHFVPIEFFSWDCLTIGALGWGQIQIANANKITIVQNQPRRQWMLDFCDVMLRFYPREIEKIAKRVNYFERAKERWLSK